jgi:hypothetical protein
MWRGCGFLLTAAIAFVQDKPVFISQAPVTEEELESYNRWKEANGEVFR